MAPQCVTPLQWTTSKLYSWNNIYLFVPFSHSEFVTSCSCKTQHFLLHCSAKPVKVSAPRCSKTHIFLLQSTPQNQFCPSCPCHFITWGSKMIIRQLLELFAQILKSKESSLVVHRCEKTKALFSHLSQVHQHWNGEEAKNLFLLTYLTRKSHYLSEVIY